MKERQPINQDALKTLSRILERFNSDFSLILAHCNYRIVRENIIQQLQHQYPGSIKTVTIDSSITNLYNSLVEAIESEENLPQALIISGLESNNQLDILIKIMNQMREEFRHQFHCPLVLWVTDSLLQALIRIAPDFYSWSTSITFESSTEDLLNFIRQTVEQVSITVLDSGTGIFLNNSCFNLELGSPLRLELELARQELQERGESLNLELEASLEFVLGRVSDHSKPVALEHYKRSLELWKQTNNLIRCGQLYFYVGFWWHNYGILHRAEKDSAYHQAHTYYAQCVHTFKQANHWELVAKFINALADILLGLKKWEELEEIANESIYFNKTYNYPFREARAYHFLAEVSLARGAWQDAKNLAEQAQNLFLKTCSNYHPQTSDEQLILDWETYYHQGWYLITLAKALQQLNQSPDAIKTLEKAKARTKPQYDPDLYIQILQLLQELYFQKGEYLIAYEIKQKRREIEQQFRLRAFIGAGRLGHIQTITNPSLPPIPNPKSINPEITASGRLSVVDLLCKRISRNDCKLTVIYGQSGVGKSSILQAGFIPELQNNLFDTRRYIPVLLQVYTNLNQDFSRALAQGIREVKNIELDSSGLTDQGIILEQIKMLVQQNFGIAIIFDQFEEFFFTCKDNQQRQKCYQFIKDCLDIAYVKIVISLREDYLHYLLECTRQGYLESIGNNILDRNILAYIGNFTPEEAKSVIQSLTERTQFFLEANLIDQLVADLAEDLGEIRPIELQVVGSQLQAQGITTLKQYQQAGQKKQLVESYLDEVIKDCGTANKSLAELVLYLLTDENNTRPLKTRSDLVKEIKELAKHFENINEKLDTVLKIFVLSGLVCLLPEIPAERYQLVHDYLVSLIRQNRSSEVLKELEKARNKSQQLELEKQKLLKRQFLGSIAFLLFVAGLFSSFLFWRINDLKSKKNDLILANENTKYTALVNENNQIDSLLSLLIAGKLLKENSSQSAIHQETLSKLGIAIQVLQEQNILDGHQKNSVLGVSISPDYQRIASASNDNTIKLWTRDGQLLQTLQGHKDSVWSVTFSPNSQLIASASKDKTIKLWKRDGALIDTFKGHTGEVKWVSFSPDGQQIISASKDKTIKIWSLEGRLIQTLNEHQTPVFSVVFSPDGQLIASSSEDGIINLWTRQGQLIKTIAAHSKTIGSVSFSPDSQIIASASDDTTIKLWTRQGELITTLEGHQQPVNSASFSSDGSLIATGSSDKTIKVWDKNGILISSFEGHKDTVNQVAFLDGNKSLVSTSKDGLIRIWSLQKIPRIIQMKDYRIFNLSFNPKNSQLIASPGRDLRTEEPIIVLWTLKGDVQKIFRGHRKSVNNVSFSPDGKIIASASDDKTVKLWNLEGKEIQTLRHDSTVWSVAFSPNGKWIATANDAHIINIWDIQGELKHSFQGHQEQINDLSFSPDSQSLASVSYDRTIKIWNVNKGKLINTLKTGNSKPLSVNFSSDSKFLAAPKDDGSLLIWKNQNLAWQPFGTSVVVGKHWKTIYEVNFSPNSKILASASLDGMIKLWDVNGILITTLKPGLDSVLSANFSPDQTQLVAIEKVSNSSNNSRIIVFKLDTTLVNQPVDILLEKACGQIKDYLNNHPSVNESNPTLCPKVHSTNPGNG